MSEQGALAREYMALVSITYMPLWSSPSIQAIDLAGNTFDLNKLIGKRVLLNFSLIDSLHCVGAAQMLNRMHDNTRKRI